MEVGSSNTGTCYQAEIENLQLKMKEMESALNAKNKEITDLKHKLELERFGITRFSYDDEMIEFYTGFPTYEVFMEFLTLSSQQHHE